MPRDSAHAAHAAALLQLAKAIGSGETGLEATLRKVTEAATAALALERTGIWFYDEPGTSIRCVELYEVSKDQHGGGTVLKAADFPRYFQALARERVIAAHDAHTDPRTSEFEDCYLKPLNIGSLLDAPIWCSGKVVGVVCHEHVGPARRFTPEDENFTGAVADLVSLALETDRRMTAESELRQREAHLRILAETAHDLVFEVDAAGCYAYLGPNLERVLGYHAEALLGRPVLDQIHPDDRAGCAVHMAAARSGTTLVTSVARHRAHDGNWLPFECSVSHYVDREGAVRLVVVARNVSERLAAEAKAAELQTRLARTQRLEAVGRLAGGIAHDFNNMLTVISGAAEELLGELPSASPLRESADQIVEAARRSGTLTRQLLAFSSRELIQAQVVDVGNLVRDLDRMLRRLIGEDVQLLLSIGEQPARVLADPAQLEQVLVNLVVNARDAMPSGGTLTLGVERVLLSTPPGDVFGELEAGEWIVLTVADSGEGIDLSLHERIFDPFFTTKEHGRGTGLGLASVYGIARQLGGAVELQSRLGQGATFRVYLKPHAGEQTASSGSAGRLAPRTSSRILRILLVEDERLVRDVLASALSDAGHQVQSAASPAEALQLLSRVAELDLLVTDVVMPGMSGVELWRRLQLDRPGLPALLISGYPDRAGTGEAHLPAGAGFLAKPFAPSELLQRVAELAGPAQDRPASSPTSEHQVST